MNRRHDAHRSNFPVGLLGFSGALLAAGLLAGPAAAEQLLAESLEDSVRRVEFGAQGTLLVEQGSPARFTIASDDEDVLEKLEIDVSSSRLVIREEDDGWFDFWGSDVEIQVHVVLPRPESIGFGGAGELDVRGVEVDDLEVEIAGAAQCRLTGLDVETLDVALAGAGDCGADGRAERLDVAIAGAGDFEALELAVARAEVAISGAGDASLRVSETLDVRIAGVGSVEYEGDPEVTKDIAGLGSVERR